MVTTRRDTIHWDGVDGVGREVGKTSSITDQKFQRAAN